MSTIGVRDLQRNPGQVLDELKRTERPGFVTRRGQPAAVLLVDEDAIEDYILTNEPEYVASRKEADEDGRTGRTHSARDVIAEIEAEDPNKRAWATLGRTSTSS